MVKSNIIKFYFLDASAIVKLVTKETDGDAIRNYFPGAGTFHSTLLCIAEALNAHKLKWKRDKLLNDEEYVNSAYLLMSYVEDKLIDPWPLSLEDHNVFVETEGLVTKHNLDFSDALQLYSLQTGFYRLLSDESSPYLITADSDLAKAAKSEGLKVWNGASEPPPY